MGQTDSKHAETHGHQQQKAKAYLSLGDGCIWDNQFEKAIQSYKNVLEIAQERGDKQSETNAYIRLGRACTFSNQLQTAIQYSQKALEIAQKRGDKKKRNKCVHLVRTCLYIQQSASNGYSILSQSLGNCTKTWRSTKRNRSEH
jgi:tetratricopeptide (TPR) repeat protein